MSFNKLKKSEPRPNNFKKGDIVIHKGYDLYGDFSQNKVYTIDDIDGEKVKINGIWWHMSLFKKADNPEDYLLNRVGMTMRNFRLDMEELGYSISESSDLYEIRLLIKKVE